jgi:hypothetical protein
VYQTKNDNYDDMDYPHDDIYDSRSVSCPYRHFGNTGNNTNTNRFGNNGKLDKALATFLPRDEWNKLTKATERSIDCQIAKNR